MVVQDRAKTTVRDQLLVAVTHLSKCGSVCLRRKREIDKRFSSEDELFPVISSLVKCNFAHGIASTRHNHDSPHRTELLHQGDHTEHIFAHGGSHRVPAGRGAVPEKQSFVCGNVAALPEAFLRRYVFTLQTVIVSALTGTVCFLIFVAHFRDIAGTSVSIKGLRINVVDVNWRPPQTILAKKMLNEAVTTAPGGDKMRAIKLDDGSFVDIPVSEPWFEQWRETFLTVQFPADHEFTRHLLCSRHADCDKDLAG